MSSGGGSSSQQPTSQTVTQSNIPEWARPYAERMLGQAEALTDINQNPYQTYGGQRIADLNALQQKAVYDITGMGIAGQLNKATDLATIAGNTASQSVYNPAAAQNFYSPLDTSFQSTTAPSLQNYQMTAPGNVSAERVASTYDYTPERVAAYQYSQLAMDPAERVRAQRLQEYRMGPAL